MCVLEGDLVAGQLNHVHGVCAVCRLLQHGLCREGIALCWQTGRTQAASAVKAKYPQIGRLDSSE